jgi:hypothetical protein
MTPDRDSPSAGLSPKRRWSIASKPAAVAISLLSWTFPRLGFLKFSDVFALLAAPGVLVSGAASRALLKCYWPFLLATIYSLFIAMFMVGRGDTTLTSAKDLYANPILVSFVTFFRIVVYLITVSVMTYYFRASKQKDISRTLRWAYYLAVLPGLLQIFRIYSGIHFNIPFFERSEVGPFSGVFNAGYLRVMGFEFEPLAYASSLTTVCCLSMHNRRRIPWLGMFVLVHTYSAGAILGLILALIVVAFKKLTRFIVPVYFICFVLLCWWTVEHMQFLIALSLAPGSVTERFSALYASIAMWLQHPWGIGLGLYGYFFNLYDVIGKFPAQTLDWYPNNDPAMFLVYGGPLYLAAYLYTFHFVLLRSRSYWLSIAAVALLVQSISSYLYFNPAIIVIFSMLLAGAEPILRTPTSGGPKAGSLRSTQYISI